MIRFVIAILASFLAGSQIGPQLTESSLFLFSKSFQRAKPAEYQPPFKNEGCRAIHTDLVDACEDIVIVGDEAFMACGDGFARTLYFPGAGNYDPSQRKSFDEQAFKMNLKTKKVDKLERIGYNGDSILHGLGEYVFKDDPSKINLFFVNHIRNTSCVQIYEHKIGTTQMKLLKNVCHPLILCPNDVTPVGPLEFYMTNAQRFKTGIKRKIENKYGKCIAFANFNTNLQVRFHSIKLYIVMHLMV
jgi:hypothetical protein